MKRSFLRLDSKETTNGYNDNCNSPKLIKTQQNKIEPAIFSIPDTSGEKYQPVTYEQAMAGVKTRVYSDGIFDLFHHGHARALMQAKSCFPNVELIIGVCDDELSRKMKGNTVMSEDERYDAASHCRYVDEVLRSAPWILDVEFLDSYHIDFVAHDSKPYEAPGTNDIYTKVKSLGRFVSIQRTDNVSTTDIISRIVKDYDMYVRRSIERGCSAKQLNLGFVKRQEVKLTNKMFRLKKRSANFIQKCEGKSKNAVMGFLSLFGSEGRMIELISTQKRRLSGALYPPSQQQDP